MKALVTGANGFVGSHLVEALLERGVETTCLVRRTSNLRWLEGKGVRYAYGDVTEPDGLAEAVRGQDTVFHVAGVLRGRDYAHYYRVNAEGTRNVAAASARSGSVRRLVYCSSLAAAGPSARDRPRTEDDPPSPVTDYGKSKLQGEIALAQAADNVPWTVLRPPVIYGPRDADLFVYFRLVAHGIAPLAGDGRQGLDMLFVADLARALIAAAESPAAVGRAYFLNDGGRHSTAALADAIEAALGRRALRLRVPVWMLRPIARCAEWWADQRGAPALLHQQKMVELAQPAWTCSARRAAAELGFQAKYGLAAGMEVAVEWYRSEGWL
jgi:nucleoside-diphosphate-sugar epimerase